MLFLVSVPHRYAVQMIQFVLETSGQNTTKSFRVPISLRVLIPHIHPLGPLYYTVFSWKTQASFVEIHGVFRTLCDLRIETGVLPCLYLHHEHPFGYTDLRRGQSYTAFLDHELLHPLCQQSILFGVSESDWFGS
jgi:hypothetical protein